MDFAQLKTSLKTDVAPVYLLYGADIFLLYKAVELIKNTFTDAEVTNFDDTVADEEVITALETPSFFLKKRIVIYKLGEKINAVPFNAYIKSPDPDSILVLMGFADKNIYNIKNAVEVNCNPMEADLLVKLIANQILPKRIKVDAARYLVEATGGIYGLINSELSKLVTYYTDVQTFEVGHLSPFINKSVDYQFYELGTSILKAKVTDAEKILNHILSTGIAEYAIFGGVVSQFRRAFYSVSTLGDENNVAKILACSPYAIKYGRRDFGGKKQEVANMYRKILDLEYMIKSGQITITGALSSLIYR